jgi:hypothetical protein
LGLGWQFEQSLKGKKLRTSFLEEPELKIGIQNMLFNALKFKSQQKIKRGVFIFV